MASSDGKAVHWQREGHSTVSSWIVAEGAQKVIDFMTEVLNAHTLLNMLHEDKTVMHASLRIGDTVVMIHDPTKEAPAFPAWLHVYVEDVDKTYKLALSKDGVESVVAPKDEAYGDRMCGVKDSAGNTWWIATQKFVPECQGKADK